MTAAASLTAERRRELWALWLDSVVGEAVRALRLVGIEPVLLKSAAFARLYPGGARAPGVDADLLVSPREFEVAVDSLARIGFERPPSEVEALGPPHAATLRRKRDGALVDLHRSFHGVGTAPEAFAAAIRRCTSRVPFGRDQALVPDAPALALLVALHAAVGAEKSREDLAHALDRLTPEAWRAAAELAGELDATTTFAAGLGRLPAGRELARRLGVEAATTAELRLRAANAPHGAFTVERFARADGVVAKTRIAARALVPPPAYVRTQSRRALPVAYLARAAMIARRLAPAVAAWRLAR